jgi:hypothetical protein
MALRIDKLTPGTSVVLDMGYEAENSVFLGIEGSGDKREARFLSVDKDGKTYEWRAYRYNGHWAYGTSADYLRLDQIRHNPFVA